MQSRGLSMAGELEVWSDVYAKSWPLHEQGEVCSRVEVADALTFRWDTEARFAAYVSSCDRRLSVDAAGKTDITMQWFVVDVDAPKDLPIQRWRSRFGGMRLPGRPFGYWTRGGLRLMWRTNRGVDQWGHWYLDALLSLAARYDLRPDPQCRDWTRLYRLPHVVRDGVAQEHGYMCGSPSNIGEWEGLETTPHERAGALISLAITTPGWSSLLPKRDEPEDRVSQSEVPRLAEHAIRWAEKRILEATPGERNGVLFATARWLSERQDVPLDDGRKAIYAAAKEAGLQQREIVATLRSAYRKAG